jgi:hypothetical protein
LITSALEITRNAARMKFISRLIPVTTNASRQFFANHPPVSLGIVARYTRRQ